MSKKSARKSFVAISCLIVTFIALQVVFASGKLPGQAEGQKHYENNDLTKSVASFKTALSKAYPELGGKAKGDEKALLADLDNEKKAAIANYHWDLSTKQKVTWAMPRASTAMHL